MNISKILGIRCKNCMLNFSFISPRVTSKLVNDNTEAFYRMSRLYFELGEEEDALREIRECLKLDPDHKECFPHYKLVKKLEKQLKAANDFKNNGQYQDAVDKLVKALDTVGDIPPFVLRIRTDLCHCHSKLSNLTGGKHWCGLALEMDPENADVLCDRAELYISQQMYEEAIEDYQTANKIENHPNRVCTLYCMTFLVY